MEELAELNLKKKNTAFTLDDKNISKLKDIQIKTKLSRSKIVDTLLSSLNKEEIVEILIKKLS